MGVPPARSPARPGPRYPALLALLRASETIWNASRLFFRRWDLSAPQFNLLNALHEEPRECTQTALSRLLITHRSNVTGLIDRLEKRGLVRRKSNPRDRRVCLLVLTGRGRRLLEKILPEYYRAAEALWGDLPAGQVRRLGGDLEKLLVRVDAFTATHLTE